MPFFVSVDFCFITCSDSALYFPPWPWENDICASIIFEISWVCGRAKGSFSSEPRWGGPKFFHLHTVSQGIQSILPVTCSTCPWWSCRCLALLSSLFWKLAYVQGCFQSSSDSFPPPSASLRVVLKAEIQTTSGNQYVQAVGSCCIALPTEKPRGKSWGEDIYITFILWNIPPAWTRTELGFTWNTSAFQDCDVLLGQWCFSSGFCSEVVATFLCPHGDINMHVVAQQVLFLGVGRWRWMEKVKVGLKQLKEMRLLFLHWLLAWLVRSITAQRKINGHFSG